VRRRVAEIVSLVFAPQVYGGIAGVAIWLGRGGGFDVPIVLALTLTVLPLLPIVISAKRGETDIFVSEREKRWKYYLLSILSYMLGLAYTAWRGYALYAALCLSYALSAAALAAITVALKWKISVHTAGIAGPTTALVRALGLECAPLFLLLAPVAWARYELKAHTPGQLVAGAIVAAAVTSAVFAIAAM
jgi:membrane-associated phospholipid phosphatase